MTTENTPELCVSKLFRLETTATAQRLKSRLQQQLHRKLLETEGLSVPHSVRILSYLSQLNFYPVLYISLPLFTSSIFLSLRCDCSDVLGSYLFLPLFLPSDYFPALLSIFPNPSVKIPQTHITLSDLLICLTPSFAATQFNLFQFCTCTCDISQFLLLLLSSLFPRCLSQSILASFSSTASAHLFSSFLLPEWEIES